MTKLGTHNITYINTDKIARVKSWFVRDAAYGLDLQAKYLFRKYQIPLPLTINKITRESMWEIRDQLEDRLW